MNAQPNKQNRFVPLSQDIKLVIENFKNNTGKGVECLCNDAPVASMQKLKDGKPVFDIPLDDFLFWFDTTHNHIFPTAENMIRLAYLNHLHTYECCSIVLKAMFEKQFAQGFFTNFEEVIYEPTFINNNMDTFKPDSSHLYEIFINTGSISREDVSEIAFASILDDLIDTKSFLLSYKDVLENFGNKKEEEINIVKKEEDAGLVSLFFDLKKRYKSRINKMGELTNDLLEIKIINQNMEDEYLKQYGKTLLELKQLFFTLEIIGLKIECKKRNPKFTEKEIDIDIEKTLIKFDEEINCLKKELGRTNRPHPNIDALLAACGIQGKGSLSMEFEYINEIKKTVKELSFMLHPDLLSEEDREKLTDIHIAELKELFNKLMDVKKNIPFTPNMLGYSHPDLLKLFEIRVWVFEIYKEAGIKTNTEEIPGKTLAEKISNLEKSIKFLEVRITEIDNEKYICQTNQLTKQYEQILGSAISIKRHKDSLNEEIENYKIKIEEQKAILKKLLHDS